MAERSCRSRNTVLELGDKFVAATEAKGYSPATIRLYRQVLRDFEQFLEFRDIRNVQDVTGSTIGEYRRNLRERKFSAAGEDTYYRRLKEFFRHLEQNQEVFENPFAGAEPPRNERKTIPVPNKAEVVALLSAVDVNRPTGLRMRAILEVAYSTGARLEELSRMKYSELDLANGTIRVMGKGNRERLLPLGKTALEWVSRYITEVRQKTAVNGSDSLWVGVSGKGLCSRAIGIAIKRHAGETGTATPITPHGLRRACATHLLQNGAHPVHIQMLLGHSSLQHLTRYLRVTFRELRAMHERSILGQ